MLCFGGKTQYKFVITCILDISYIDALTAGFAENQFNFGADAHVGNHVELVSGTRVFTCDIHKDGCTEVQLMCYTRSVVGILSKFIWRKFNNNINVFTYGIN